MRVFHTGYHTVVCHTHLCNVSTNYCLVYRSFVCISHNPVNLIKSVFCDKIRFISYHPLSTSHETHSFNKPLYICLSSFEIRVRLLLLISGTFIKKKNKKKRVFLFWLFQRQTPFLLILLFYLVLRFAACCLTLWDLRFLHWILRLLCLLQPDSYWYLWAFSFASVQTLRFVLLTLKLFSLLFLPGVLKAIYA